MSKIRTNYIDFRSEHRIYLHNGWLTELVGMIADTDYDNWEKNKESGTIDPVTWYKFITDPQFMYDGGYYREGDLPSIFAHRGDKLRDYQVMTLLDQNIYFHLEDPILILEDHLKDLDLTCILSDQLRNIRIRLCSVWSGYRVELNTGGSLMFIKVPKEEGKGIVLTIDGHKQEYSFRKLAKSAGQILYALRAYFHEPDICISDVSIVENECLPDQRLVPAPEPYFKFLRLIEMAAKMEERHWDQLEAEFGRGKQQDS